MLVGMKLQMLFLVVGVEFEVVRHGPCILDVLNHGAECGG
jgi:hypothetical protein